MKVAVRVTKSKVLVAVVVIVAVVLLVFWLGARDTGSTVKVYILQGLISESGSSISYITPRDIRDKLNDSKKAGALVLRITSPGGSVVASQEILDLMRKFKEETGTPLVVSMGEMATSGGYYISLGADRIVANAGTLTGSIGVISQFVYLEGLYDKLGIDVETVKSGKYKDMGTRPLTDDEMLVMRNLSDNIYMQFVREVAMARKMSVEEAMALATGEVYSGEQAWTLGLIDNVGTLKDAIDIAAARANISEPKVKIVEQDGMLRSLMGTVSRLDGLFRDVVFGLSVRW